MDAHDRCFPNVATMHRIGAASASPIARGGAWVRPTLLAATGGVALSVGILVYLADRPGSHAGFIPEIAMFSGLNLFGKIGQWLPSFVHPFSFSLFTAAVLKPGVAVRIGASTFWGAVNVAFEVGQHPALHSRWIDAMHRGAGDWAIPRSVLNYFLHGTFDPCDLDAAMLGALAAGVLLHFADRCQGAHHAPN